MRRPLLLVPIVAAACVVSLWFALRGGSRGAALDALAKGHGALDAPAELEPASTAPETAQLAHEVGTAPGERRVLAADPREVATLAVRVLASPSGEAVRRARVRVAWTKRTEPSNPSPPDAASAVVELERGELRATTDWRGRAELEVPCGVGLLATVEGPTQAVWDPAAEQYGSAKSEVGALARGERRALDASIPCGFDRVLWLRVVDASGAPIVGARVAGAAYREAAETAGNGLARLEGRSWERGQLGIEREGFVSVEVRPESGHASPDDPLEVPLSASAALEAHLRLPPGFAEPGAELVLELSTTRPGGDVESIVLGDVRPADFGVLHPTGSLDANGTARIATLQAGLTYFAALTRDGELAWCFADALVLEPGERRRVEWSVSEGVTVSGRLLDEDASGASVGLVRDDGDAPASADVELAYADGIDDYDALVECDEEGRFAFRHVQPGRWLVVPDRGERAFDDEDEDEDGSARLGPARIGVRFQVGGGGGSIALQLPAFDAPPIRGRVVDAKGSPVAGVAVVARSTEIGGSLTTRSDSEGRFELGPLHPSLHELRTLAWEPDSSGVEGPHAKAKPGDAVELVLGE